VSGVISRICFNLNFRGWIFEQQESFALARLQACYLLEAYARQAGTFTAAPVERHMGFPIKVPIIQSSLSFSTLATVNMRLLPFSFSIGHLAFCLCQLCRPCTTEHDHGSIYSGGIP
jgi:hypothetical protein